MKCQTETWSPRHKRLLLLSRSDRNLTRSWWRGARCVCAVVDNDSVDPWICIPACCGSRSFKKEKKERKSVHSIVNCWPFPGGLVVHELTLTTRHRFASRQRIQADRCVRNGNINARLSFFHFLESAVKWVMVLLCTSEGKMHHFRSLFTRSIHQPPDSLRQMSLAASWTLCVGNCSIPGRCLHSLQKLFFERKRVTLCSRFECYVATETCC